ncbi:MAG: hypothetical protein EA351_10715 [Gemmatimonadales bacterium]|nr:MAG: hypothetical protein EA351_10715 [Gemmatimonadales bacterium]
MTAIFCATLLAISVACCGSDAHSGVESEGPAASQLSGAGPSRDAGDPLFGSFTFGAWIQPLFELRDWQDQESTVGFRLRRARFIVNGKGLDGRLRFRLMPDLASTPQLRDAWIQLDGDVAWIRMGQQTVPFSLQREVTMARGHFGDRALASRRFELSGGRDIGVVAGSATSDGRLRVSAGAFNGRGPNRSDPSPFPLLAARGGVALGGPVPNGETDLARTPGTVVALGGAVIGSRDSFLRPRPGFAADQTADWRSWTIDLLARSRGVSVTAAWFAQSVTTPPPGASPTSVEILGEGWYLGAGWLLPLEAGLPVPDMELVVRHSRARWDLDREGSGERESAIGLTLFHRDHAVQTRLQLTRERGMLTGLSDRSTRLTIEHQLFM